MKTSGQTKATQDDWSDEREEITLKESEVLLLPNGREVKLLEEVTLIVTRRNVHAATD